METLFQINGNESAIFMSLLAMAITTILSIVITKVYQLTFTGDRYSQNFVHTIIMMSVVVSVVMNVVSGNAGVAFGLFAVFSLIRFRSAVTDAKDIAYIFFGLSVGMTSGLYQFDLAIILTFFASILFYFLYKFEYGKGKDTQILKVTVPENLNHENLLDDVFRQFTINHALRQVETTNLGTMIMYTYAIRSKNEVNDKDLLDRIREKNANLKVSLTYM
ncbi:DUF4956 domain-containing protein [Oceanobacillus profundus]|uniref:DUF4956 domain-containing protein n=1 Tax=Oceanobacillus profundus TaxID=372463 RepID=A0A417YHR9_9BACI|nr:DUF4956 domain-containing protein [Oceanobacillus profundus]MBR3118051.1 DUF4956 domain-containing protein [Oceanobacillus sp.]MCM3398905.1 DUF4956 domain-containing protein [Oceanobacillus profundus]RHW32503.1 DUF4956 domain-containing protein [Oceanobacillus profundus]